jgi:5-methylcytosine-specific restriction enzyme A
MVKNRSQLFKDLRVKPRNQQWAWCAKDDSIKRAVFTLWEDQEIPTNKWLLHDDNYDYKKPGYFDQKKVIDIAINYNYEIFGVVCIAVDPTTRPRSIKEIKGDFVYQLRFEVKGEKIFGIKEKKIPLIQIIRNDQKNLSNDGIQDLSFFDLGSNFPDRALSVGFIVKRDNNVRKAVLKRANGKCEYCGSKSFQISNGQNYLETHHIIHLANKGIDRVTNVIALCPNHHREAHFGLNAELLEDEFLNILKKNET